MNISQPLSAAPFGTISGSVVPLRPASTVVLLRDGLRETEVFLIRRHGASGFMAGATVFPGGKVDEADADAPANGRPDAEMAALLNLEDLLCARAFFVAAARELHEESHVLLARNADGDLATAAQIAEIDVQLDSLRSGHRLNSLDYYRVLQQAGLTLALELLEPFAHWLTPVAEPRRFDTIFFVAALPPGQQASLDPHEATAAAWFTPEQALAAHSVSGEIALPPPTWHTIDRLQQALTRNGPLQPASLQQYLALGGLGPPIQPHFLAEPPQGPAIVLPEDPWHPEHAHWVGNHGPARKYRFMLINGRLVPERD